MAQPTNYKWPRIDANLAGASGAVIPASPLDRIANDLKMPSLSSTLASLAFICVHSWLKFKDSRVSVRDSVLAAGFPREENPLQSSCRLSGVPPRQPR